MAADDRFGPPGEDPYARAADGRCPHGAPLVPGGCPTCSGARRDGLVFAVGDRVQRMNPDTGGIQRGTVQRLQVAGASSIGRIPVLFHGQTEPTFVMPRSLSPEPPPRPRLRPELTLDPDRPAISVIDVHEHLLVVTLDEQWKVGMGGNGKLPPSEMPEILRAMADQFERRAFTDPIPGRPSPNRLHQAAQLLTHLGAGVLTEEREVVIARLMLHAAGERYPAAPGLAATALERSAGVQHYRVTEAIMTLRIELPV